MTDDEGFMRLALQEALMAYRQGEVPVGAVAVRDGEVVARAHNLRETLRDPMAHAEALLLRRTAEALGGWRLTRVTLYCTLEPCPMCAGAMVLARLPRLVYALDDPKAGAAGSVIDLLQHPGLNHRVELQRGVQERLARLLFQRFFRELRAGRVRKPHAQGRCRSG
ncbi:MAG: nucleoside deaminase [Chloroflexi bacterium]|nr:nucleoside deaminase [Chloroflexota bacterium]